MAVAAREMRLRQERRRRADVLRPENSRVPDHTYADDAMVPASELTLDSDALFACECVFGGQGVIFEVGDATTGALVGVNGDGDLVARFGDGGSPPLTNGARLVIGSGLLPKQRPVRLAVGFVLSQGVFIWIDGRMRRGAVSGSVSAWSANADGAYGDVSGALPSETGITSGYTGTLVSRLRYHALRPELFGVPA